MPKGPKKVNKDAGSGKFVKKSETKSRPKTTFTETTKKNRGK
jgi:hypothetical protein